VKRHLESLSQHLPYVPWETTIENRGRDSLLNFSYQIHLPVIFLRTVYQVPSFNLPEFPSFLYLCSEKRNEQKTSIFNLKKLSWHGLTFT